MGVGWRGRVARCRRRHSCIVSASLAVSVGKSAAVFGGRRRVPSVSPSTVGADTARSDAAQLLNGRERPGRRGGPALLGWKCHHSPGV